MRSPDWTVRSAAVDSSEELLAAGKLSPSDSDGLKLGMIQLLIAENAGANVPDDEALKRVGKEGEWHTRRPGGRRGILSEPH
jgi:hypothetical protein